MLPVVGIRYCTIRVTLCAGDAKTTRSAGKIHYAIMNDGLKTNARVRDWGLDVRLTPKERKRKTMTKAEILGKLKELSVPFNAASSKDELTILLEGVLHKSIEAISLDSDDPNKRLFPTTPGTIVREVPTNEELYELQEKGALLGWKPGIRSAWIKENPGKPKFTWQPVKR